MVANYAKTYSVGGLNAGFQQVHLFEISKITVLLWNINNYFLIKIQFTI